MAPVLSGVRVVDVSTGIAAAITTMGLADQGAEVVRVVRPGTDPLDGYPGALVWSRGKERIVLDLGTAGGRADLERLAREADVLVEDSAEGAEAGSGVDGDALRLLNDRLVVCSITAYGRQGSWRTRPADDALVQARTGMQYEQAGWRDGPIFLRAPLPSYGASLLASCAINAALFVREITGRGQRVETSVFQGMQFMTVLAMSRVERPPPIYYAHYACPRQGITPSVQGADGEWFHPMPEATPAVLETLGEPPDALPGEWRGDCETVIPYHAALASLYKRLPRDEWMEILGARDLRCQPVLAVEEAFDHPQVRHNGAIVTVDVPGFGPLEQAAPPYRLERHDWAVRPAASAPITGTDAAFGTRAVAAPSASTASSASVLPHALDGILVLDLGLALAGPFGPMLLSDLGADVIRIDNVVPPRGIDDQIWAGCQRGKRSISLDMKSPDGLELARRLVRRADVLHHNMRPGAAERLGVGYEDVRAINPRIVYCHVSGFGESGPLVRAGGCDQMAQALSGLEHDQGAARAGRGPTWLRFGMCDHVGAVASVVGVLQALYERERTGEGQLVTANLLDAGMFLQSDALRRPGSRDILPRGDLDAEQTGLGPLVRLYRTADGWICIACRDDEAWRALCEALERPDLVADARFATAEGRGGEAAALGAELGRVFATRTAPEWFAVLDGAGVPCEVADEGFVARWYDDPDVVANGFVARYRHPVWGLTEQMGALFGLSETPARVAGPPVVPGQHGIEILQELGCGPEEIDDLLRRRVTTVPVFASADGA